MTAKNHHYVPQIYLLGWAKDGQQIAFRRRGMDSAKSSTVRNLASENGFHGTGEEAIYREKFYAEFEGKWNEYRERLISESNYSNALKLEVANYIAHQRLRTREERASRCFAPEFLEWIGKTTFSDSELTKYYESVLGLSNPTKNEIFAARLHVEAYKLPGSKGPVVANPDLKHFREIARKIIEILMSSTWRIEHSKGGHFITCDSPVTYWRPRTPNDETFGIGPETCSEFWFPLNPHFLLVIERNGNFEGLKEATRERELHVNSEIASRSYSSIFGSLEQKLQLENLKLKEKKPFIRFRTLDDNFRLIADPKSSGYYVIHSFVPSHDGLNINRNNSKI